MEPVDGLRGRCVSPPCSGLPQSSRESIDSTDLLRCHNRTVLILRVTHGFLLTYKSRKAASQVLSRYEGQCVQAPALPAERTSAYLRSPP
jgi:hypothetical protein